MGLLSKGTPLDWEEAKQYADHVRKHGIQQFLAIYRRLKDRCNDELLWGDEVEYMVVRFDEDTHTVQLALRALDLLEHLQEDEHHAIETGGTVSTLWRPEYGRYMLEGRAPGVGPPTGTPGAPYGSTVRGMLDVEGNMVLRRSQVRKLLAANERLMTLTSFPRLGCPRFLYPHVEPRGEASHSLFIPDEAINTHPRFRTLTANIRKRRGTKVAINIPIFKDTNTPQPFVETFPTTSPFPEGPQGALPDHIYLDAMCFGMGCCCLQVTFQACSIREARRLYDQLATVTPVMLALTAAAPIYRGYLSDYDVRWHTISASVDDRTPEERGLEPLHHNRFRINKSRYDSIDCYISEDETLLPEYNDLDLVYDHDIYDQLRAEGVDHLLARHVAHLFIRDPLVIYRELLNQDDSVSSDHFENIQSTNWQTMRFKPPPPNSPIGWRVEFRSMEVQLTDFENAAFTVFIGLLTRAILSFNLNLYLPISKVDENLKTAHKRDAARTELFYFRDNIFPPGAQPIGDHVGVPKTSSGQCDSSNSFSKRSLNEIFNGKVGLQTLGAKPRDPRSRRSSNAARGANPLANTRQPGEFIGLVPLVRAYLQSINVDVETQCSIGRYLGLISQRASGQLLTPATWMRQFVHAHPKYRHDSVVSDEIAHDLVYACAELSEGRATVPELLGSFATVPSPSSSSS